MKKLILPLAITSLLSGCQMLNDVGVNASFADDKMNLSQCEVALIDEYGYDNISKHVLSGMNIFLTEDNDERQLCKAKGTGRTPVTYTAMFVKENGRFYTFKSHAGFDSRYIYGGVEKQLADDMKREAEAKRVADAKAEQERQRIAHEKYLASDQYKLDQIEQQKYEKEAHAFCSLRFGAGKYQLLHVQRTGQDGVFHFNVVHYHETVYGTHQHIEVWTINMNNGTQKRHS